MALTAPTPPTPPTPPSAPRITLGGGGSVTETAKPQGHERKTDDELHEQQAREAVASGSGPLSRTTTSQGKDERAGKEKAQDGQAAQPSKPATQNTAPSGNTVRESVVQQGGPPAAWPDERSGQDAPARQESVTQVPAASRSDGHGMLYWGGMLIAVLLIVVVVLRTVLFRKKEGAAAGNASLPSGAEPRPKAGMTAEEVLQSLEPKKPRTPAPRAASEYAAQAAAPPKAKPAPRPVRQAKKEGEERERFEVRI